MNQFVRITADGPEDGIVDEPAEVHVKRVWSHGRYGGKIGFDIPAPWDDERASDELKERLNYDTTHRRWNDQADEWEADLDALNRLVMAMTDAGYTVTVDLEVAKEFESRLDGVFLPEFRN